jgi:hypothetical protein
MERIRNILGIIGICEVWILKSLIPEISVFHFVNGVWNTGKIFWHLGVSNNHLGFCLYESQSNSTSYAA